MDSANAADAGQHSWLAYAYNEQILHELLNAWPAPVLLLLIAACIFVLVKGADLLVEGAVSIAERSRLPNIVIGATIVSIGTTTPECFVSVMGAWFGKPGLALGNGVGSIICDTGMIFGLVCLISPMTLDRFILNRQGWVQFGAALLLVTVSVILKLTMEEPILGRWFGTLCLVLLVCYIYFSIRWAKQHGAAGTQKELHEVTHHRMSIGKSLAFICCGLTMVVVSSRLLVPAVSILAERMGVPEDVIAATLVAFGTSLPELVTCMMAVRKGHPDLAVGNVIGADVLNVLFVIGTASAVVPLQIPINFYLFHFPAMMLILLLFRIFIFTNRDNRFKRWQGALLFGIYIGYIVLQYAYNLGA